LHCVYALLINPAFSRNYVGSVSNNLSDDSVSEYKLFGECKKIRRRIAITVWPGEVCDVWTRQSSVHIQECKALLGQSSHSSTVVISVHTLAFTAITLRSGVLFQTSYLIGYQVTRLK